MIFQFANCKLVGGVEHFLFFHILGMSSSQVTNSIIFQRGFAQNHQPVNVYQKVNDFPWKWPLKPWQTGKNQQSHGTPEVPGAEVSSCSDPSGHVPTCSSLTYRWDHGVMSHKSSAIGSFYCDLCSYFIIFLWICWRMY